MRWFHRPADDEEEGDLEKASDDGWEASHGSWA
jgi:hypothetical protein